MSEEERAGEEELLEVAKQLAAAPAEDVVANHCYGLFELAALHLSQQPPPFDKARLAIDALGLLVDGLGDRLGHAPDRPAILWRRNGEQPCVLVTAAALNGSHSRAKRRL